MILSLREMDVFRQVMERGSVTGAAEALRISQPAVSKMLQQAEDRLGFKLFVRVKKRLLPTTEAHSLFPEALNAFAAIDVVQRMASDLRAGRSGLLRLAVTPTLAHSILPAAISAFRAERPDVTVNMRIMTMLEAASLVADHRVDIGMVIGHIGDARVLVRELWMLSLGCVLPHGHPLCAREALTPADLAGEPIIVVARHLPAGQLVARAFEDANAELHVAVEVNQSSVACALAHGGVGVTVLDGFAVMAAREQGMETRPFLPFVPLPARILTSRQRPLPNLAASFVQGLLTINPE
ncbi:LysR family transcriptional regulator [Roseomonas terrae]|uniref:LysR family transcriptional regulator n=1 Tax=Neoroseomonas terrae TaxID=424799 RepID=A0ABS5ELX2_9PROT|nr:LysR family transcriptional regulator [Neoroseomonas terrae]MBR0652034.1 LysR family transcriptional regulator [Neoroseomonas terrae]